MDRPSADLSALQACIKVDPPGYEDEFKTQLAHYQACLDVFALSPGRPAKELGELAMFVAQVARCYPDATADFAPGLASLLTTHGRVMDPTTRAACAKALILLRNRGSLDPAAALPLWLALLALPDKALRALVSQHIIADVKRRNAKGRDERLNRAAQGALRGALDGRGAGGRAAGAAEPRAARCALGVLTDLWRRRVWRDARTANAIAAAALHPDESIALAALKFFLGEDAAEAAAGSDSDDDGPSAHPAAAHGAAGGGPVAPSGRDVHRMTALGTASSKKKKEKKLARVRRAVAKAARKGSAGAGEGFAAIQLLHDPQTFAESLFARLKPGPRSTDTGGGGGRSLPPPRPFTRADARTAALRVVSRVVGTHRLLLLNFYPHVQRSLTPHAREVSLLIAALVQATHELVPPDALAPVLKQLVDAFVHDRARPEVAVLGLNAVRELCARAPSIMDADLLSDLALYRKARDKEVAAAARGLVGLFREVAPALLARKDRGRGADMGAAPLAYGAAPVPDRVPGADLLEAAVARGSDGGEGDDDDDDDDGSGGGGSGSDWESLDEEEVGAGGEDGEGGSGASSSDGDDGSGEEEEEEEEEEEDDDDGSASEEEEGVEGAGAAAASAAAAAAAPPTNKRAAAAGSLSSLRRAVAAAAAATAPAPPTPTPPTPIEQGRILDDADFARIRALQHRARVAAAMAKHGLAPSASKRARLEMAAEDEAEEAAAAAAARAGAGERPLDPASLEARRRGRQDKAARLARVMEGREGREFGAAAARHKRKTGGLSNRQLQKRKAMPLAAASSAAARRRAASAGNRARGSKGPR